MKGSLVHKLFKARGIGKNMVMVSVPLKPKTEKLTSFWKKLKPWQKGGVIGIIFGIAIEALKYTNIPILDFIAALFSAGPGTLFLLAIDFPTTHNTLSPILRLYLPILLSGITVLFYSLLGMALMPMYDRIKRANKCRSIVFVAAIVILLFLGSVFTALRFFDSTEGGWKYSCYQQCVSKAHKMGLKWDSSADSIFCRDIHNGNSLRDIATSLMNKIRGIDKKCLNFFSEKNITVARAFGYMD